MFRTAEGRLAIHHPMVAEELPEPGGEGLGLNKKFEVSVKIELASVEGVL